MGRTTKRIGLTQRGSDEGGSTSRTSKQIEDYYSGGKRKFSYKKNDRGKIVKIPQMLTGGQAKIAAKAPPPNKIDAKDFAVLRAEKAKGRGMGLQDESVKPGKVMKAKRGSGINLPQEGSRIVFNTYSKPFKGPRDGGRVSAIVGVKPGAKIRGQRKKFKSMEEMRKAKGFKPGESSSEFMKRRKELAGATKALKATRIGKIVLPIAAAGVAASQYLKSKMKKKDEPKKKMGGGMMQKPGGFKMGYAVPDSPSQNERAKEQKARLSSGRTASRSQQPNKKERPTVVLSFGVPEGPAKQNTTIKSFKLKNRKDLKKTLSTRMSGGMMQKPMGYSKGVSVKARGCKLGRTRPTKIT
jgi:hypothetical protein